MYPPPGIPDRNTTVTELTWVPKVLRGMVLLVLGCAALGIGFGVGFLAWKSGYVEQRLGLVATTQDVKDQTEVITNRVDDTNERMATVVRASPSLRARLAESTGLSGIGCAISS